MLCPSSEDTLEESHPNPDVPKDAILQVTKNSLQKDITKKIKIKVGEGKYITMQGAAARQKGTLAQSSYTRYSTNN
jgi:alpha-D-ribose 1-methylphosphonate 5-triphosphate synthase subunit PhnL